MIGEKDSCTGLQIKEGDVLFAVKTGDGAGGSGIRWFRASMENISPTSGWYWKGYTDALKFTAKRPV